MSVTLVEKNVEFPQTKDIYDCLAHVKKLEGRSNNARDCFTNQTGDASGPFFKSGLEKIV